MRDVNQNPRRWVDESGRVCVIEGWHPSAPSRVGYNLKIDGDWLGTFGTLEGATTAATACAVTDGRDVVLRLYRDPRHSGRGPANPGLRVVGPAPDDD
ncbi:MAG: hypothetical protein WB797_17785 [Nocardioides sp.]